MVAAGAFIRLRAALKHAPAGSSRSLILQSQPALLHGYLDFSQEKEMKTRNHLLVTGFLAAMALAAHADTKITVGVGHMCCGNCKTSATAALQKVASDVSIDGNDITMTLKGDDVFTAIHTLDKAGFPANHYNVGSSTVTIAVAHLCCGKCNAGLKSALTDANLDALDTDSMKI